MQVVVDAGSVPHLTNLIQHPDSKLKRQVLLDVLSSSQRVLASVCQVASCLSQIAKHSVDLAEVVVEGEVFPKMFNNLKDLDTVVRRNAVPFVAQVVA